MDPAKCRTDCKNECDRHYDRHALRSIQRQRHPLRIKLLFESPLQSHVRHRTRGFDAGYGQLLEPGSCVDQHHLITGSNRMLPHHGNFRETPVLGVPRLRRFDGKNSRDITERVVFAKRLVHRNNGGCLRFTVQFYRSLFNINHSTNSGFRTAPPVIPNAVARRNDTYIGRQHELLLSCSHCVNGRLIRGKVTDSQEHR